MTGDHQFQWLETGDEFYSALLSAIASARESIRLETYIFAAGHPGDDLRVALIAAARRGVKTMVLIDGFGSTELPRDYWAEFAKAGGEVRTFKPLTFSRIPFLTRDHRKMLVCDSTVAFVGGFNIMTEELGDGVSSGWRDLGLRLRGHVSAELAASFDRMFESAGTKRRHTLRLSGLFRKEKAAELPPVSLLTSHPGRWISPIWNALMNDLNRARRICVITAYFLPTLQVRRALCGAAKRGGDVRIVTAGKTDVALARFAGRALYQRLLRSRVGVFEYDAQILHSKLIVADNAVYIGSANMDTRSLRINHELLVRIEDSDAAQEARRIFEGYLPHCRVIERDRWRQSRTGWEKVMERLAHFVLARLDIYFALRSLSRLR